MTLSPEERKQKQRENARRYYENNIEKVRQYQREYQRKKYVNNPEHRERERERIRQRKLKKAIDEMILKGRTIKD